MNLGLVKKQVISVLLCSERRNGVVRLEKKRGVDRVPPSKSCDFIISRAEARVCHLTQASNV